MNLFNHQLRDTHMHVLAVANRPGVRGNIQEATGGGGRIQETARCMYWYTLY